MTTIVLTRHGHVEGIRPERFRGRLDLPLTALGRSQAAATADRVARGWTPSAIYTSPLQRCVDTGAAIATATGATAQVLEALADFDYGEWTGRTWDEVREADPDGYALWFARPELARPGGADTLQAIVQRTGDALRYLLARHRDETVVVVGHDSTNRALLMQVLDQPLSAYWRLAQSPCCLNEITIKDARINVLRLNETGHLERLAEASPPG